MIAASPLSGMSPCQTSSNILRWPSEGKGTTIGVTVGIVMCQWGVAMMSRTTGHNGPSPQRHNPTNESQRIVPSSSQPSPTIWADQCGLDDRDWHTHSTSQGPLFPRGSHHHWHLLCTRAPIIVLCVPFGDPHVHQVTTSKETKLECSHSNANTLGPVHHMARTHQTDDKSK